MRVVCVLVASVAGAQGIYPSVVPFPLELHRLPPGASKKEREDLAKVLPLLVKAAPASTPDSGKLEVALKELKRADCEREDACLSQLASLSGALYGLFVSIDTDREGNLTATGRVVRDDGKLIAGPKTTDPLKVRRNAKEIGTQAMTRLIAELGVGTLSPLRPVEAKVVPPEVHEPVVEAKPPEVVLPPPLTPSEEPTRRVLVGKTLLGVGLGVAAVGGIIWGVGGGVAGGLKPNQGSVAPDQVGTFQTARTLSTVGIVGLGVGAAAAAVGAVLWTTAPKLQVSLEMGRGSSGIAVSGAF